MGETAEEEEGQTSASQEENHSSKEEEKDGGEREGIQGCGLTVVQYVTAPPPHTHTHQSTEAVCEEGKEVEEMGAESEGGDESHSNNRLRKRTTTVARTRDESDEESRGSEDEDEEEWEHLQKSVPKQKNKLDLASNESHPVHAPFFPEVCVVQLCDMSSVSCFSCVVLQEKQEGWWLYMAEKRSRTMVTMPQGVTTLKDECSVRLCKLCCTRQ